MLGRFPFSQLSNAVSWLFVSGLVSLSSLPPVAVCLRISTASPSSSSTTTTSSPGLFPESKFITWITENIKLALIVAGVVLILFASCCGICWCSCCRPTPRRRRANRSGYASPSARSGAALADGPPNYHQTQQAPRGDMYMGGVLASDTQNDFVCQPSAPPMSYYPHEDSTLPTYEEAIRSQQFAKC